MPTCFLGKPGSKTGPGCLDLVAQGDKKCSLHSVLFDLPWCVNYSKVGSALGFKLDANCF